MHKPRAVFYGISLILLLTFVSSAHADSIQVPPGLEKLNLVEGQTLDLPETGKIDLTGLISQHFANNNGRHLGFSVAAFHGGLKFGLANPRRPTTTVTENPEPTGILLLGTGLAAAAAFARRINRRRRHSKAAD